MKYCILLLSLVTPAISLAMEKQEEQQLQIWDRNLNTAEKPHITIINLLPKSFSTTTRIDISDKTKTNCYIAECYKPDDSTKTIYSNQGIRFDPRFNKTGEPEHQRLGMNDAGDTALIVLYIYADKESPCYNLVIGKGSEFAFGDELSFTASIDGKILLHHNDTTTCRLDDTEQKTIGIDYNGTNENYLEKNSYIHNILHQEELAFASCILTNLFHAAEIKDCETEVQKLINTGKTDELEPEKISNIQDILQFMVPDHDFSDSDTK